MLNKEIKICKILTFSEEDFLTFNLEFNSSGVEVILSDTKDKIEFNYPTIIVGWENVKKILPKQRISQKKIDTNVYWVYNSKEDKKTSLKETASLVKSFLLRWLPDMYVSYDYVLDGSLSDFFKKHLTKPYDLYIYFSGKALFVYNPVDAKKLIGINLESLKYAGLDIKKSIKTIIEKYNPICLSYSNINLYISENHNLIFNTIENIFWSKHNEEISEKNFYDFIMDVDGDRFIPFLMFELKKNQIISENEKKYIDRLIRKDVITQWLSKCELFLDKKYFTDKTNLKEHIKLSYSNKRTITGRINCVNNEFNPQKLQKEGDERKIIISKFKQGKIVTFDYNSFESKIALFLSQDKDFIAKYRDKDLHFETARIVFEKNEINSKQRSIGKSLNHALIYGGGNEVLKRIVSDLTDSEKIIVKVKEFLKPILDKSDEFKLPFEELGYMINSFGTIVRPRKKWAHFSNFVSTLAADILVEKLYQIKDLLENKESNFLFQVHDSFVFDIHPDEMNLLNDITTLLSHMGDLNFQVDYSIGNNFYECTWAEEENVIS